MTNLQPKAITALVLTLILGLGFCLRADTSPYTPPYIFVPNTLIQSSQVNANFSQAASIINNLDNSNIQNNAAIDPNKLSHVIAFPLLLMTNGSTVTFSIGQSGDTFPRIEFVSDGSLRYGPGAGTTVDVGLYRTAVGELSVRNGTNAADAALKAASLVLSATPLGVPSGGTGLATITAGSYVKGNGAGIVTLQAAPIPVTDGGTGATALAGHGAVVMNAGGTAETVIAPGANTNALVSNGTDWVASGVTVGMLPSTAIVTGGVGGSTSPRAIPTGVVTLTGDYWHVGDYTSTGNITCNRCRLHVRGNFTLSTGNTLTVNAANTETSGGLAITTVSTGGAGAGPGAGNINSMSLGATINNGGGGGGGNGGIGGNGGGVNCTAAGGNTYPIETFLAGSGGAAGTTRTTQGGFGGSGGGALFIECSGNVTLTGNVSAVGNGGTGGSGASDGGGGGGSGGTVAVICNGAYSQTGTINVSGGSGGVGGGATIGGGGGGGGGKVWVRAGSGSLGTCTLTGGSGGSNGTITSTNGGAGTSDFATGTWVTRTAP